MFRLILFFVGFLGFVFGECPSNSLSLEMNDTICYSFHSRLSKFAYAQTHCNSFGGQLVSLKNEYINVYITHFANLIFDDIVFFWSGGNKLKNPVEFEWGNGDKVEYQRFKNDAAKTNGSCIATEVNQGFWKADNCFAEFSFICEFDASKNVTPIDADPLDIDDNDGNSTTELYPSTVFPGTTPKGASEQTKMPTSAPLTVTQNPPNPQPTGAPLPSLNPEPVNSTASQVPSTGKQNPFNPATPTSSVFVTPEKTVTLSTAVPSPATDGPINPTTTETPAPVTSEGTTRFSTAVPFTATVVPVNPSTIIQKGPCPEGWELFDHFCYKSYPKKKYADAEADCQKQGAHLASVHNENENLFIAELGHKAHPENSCRRLEQMWIGLDRKNGDNFVWIDKTSNDYTNWGPLQPDNHGHKNESCTQINIAKDCDKVNQTERYTTTFEQGKWNDYLCNYKLAYVCKKASSNKNPEVTTPAHMPAEPTTEAPTAVPVLTCPFAEADCQSQGGHIASIHNEKENLFIAELGQQAAGNNSCKIDDQLWIGLHKNKTDSFYWLDNSPKDYTNWANGNQIKPINYEKGNERCAELIIAKDCEKINVTEFYTTIFAQGEWNDDLCDKEMQYICKKDAQNDAHRYTPSTKKTVKPVTIVPSSTPEKVATTVLAVPMTDSPPKVPACPEGWELFEGFCYQIFPKKNYIEAEADCESKGAHIASIHSENENNFITEFGHKIEGNNSCEWFDQMWIGMDGSKSDKFVWLDNSVTDYENWGPSEPNNYQKNERCTDLIIGKDCSARSENGKYVYYPQGKWNDYECEKEMQYICKKSVVLQ